MYRTILTFALVALFVAVPTAFAGDGGDLFNGKDLDNFDKLDGYWSVKDGAIVGNSGKTGLKFNTFLCSKKKFSDFELSFEIRLKGGVGNSGVQVRSKIDDEKKFAVAGPQCDIGGVYWGSLYGERFGGMMLAAPRDVVKKVHKKGEFNSYYIKCEGKHVTIKLNGATTVDKEFAKVPPMGIIAFQLHAGPPMEVTFRNIVFKPIEK